MNKRKLIAAALAACMALVMLAGCSETEKGTETSSSASETTVAPGNETTEETVSIGTGRVPENVEDYAIFKYSSTPPEGYDTVEESEVGNLYLNGKAKITVQAQNYKEDYQELSVFAETACATFRVHNMLYQQDTTFGEPVKTKVAGFDAIVYDYEIIAYEFVHDEDETTAATTAAETSADGAETTAQTTVTGVKTEVARFKGKLCYFYSDEDVFYVQFESAAEDFEKESAVFDDYLATVKISKK